MGMHKHMHTKKDNKLISYFPLGEADKTLKENLKKKNRLTQLHLVIQSMGGNLNENGYCKT